MGILNWVSLAGYVAVMTALLGCSGEDDSSNSAASGGAGGQTAQGSSSGGTTGEAEATGGTSTGAGQTGGASSDCTGYSSAFGINVLVRGGTDDPDPTGPQGQLETCYATVTVVDGDYVETPNCGPKSRGCGCAAAKGRPGSYTVTVEYGDVTESVEVEVPGDECGVFGTEAVEFF